MQRKALTVCLGALLMITATARAGLVASPHANPHPSDAQSAADPASRLPFAPAFCDGPGVVTIVASELPGDFESDSENGQIAALPPAPDSAVLAFSGLLSLGAIQLGRNVRKLHLSALPDWYHEHAGQVGHSTPFNLDLDFSLSAMPVCRFEAPVAAGDEEPSPTWWLRLEPIRQLAPQHFLHIAVPRGPPLLSL